MISRTDTTEFSSLSMLVACQLATLSDKNSSIQCGGARRYDFPYTDNTMGYTQMWLLEKIILNRISDNLVTNPNQFGFKPKHNTEMCIFALKEAILKYRALNSNVYSCFLDASKAFDRVNHSKLFDTLVKRGVPLYIIRIIRFWYTSQTMYVRWNNVMSSGFKVTNGVRQGGILSPYLFCVYADELSRMLNNVNAGCFVGASLVNHLMYADDLVLLAPSAAGLSLLLSACSYYGIEFDVKFNSAKSNLMVFCCNLLKDIPVPNFMLNGVAIDKVSNCKYLGHCINDKLIDDDDMARQRKQIYAQGNALVRKFYMCTETVRISLFKSYCSSLYTSSLWCNYRSESLRKLCVAYNNVFRKITFLPRDCSASLMFATRDLPTCKTLIRKHAYIFMKSVAESRNVILHSIVRSDSLFTSPLWQHWRNLLYVHPF